MVGRASSRALRLKICLQKKLDLPFAVFVPCSRSFETSRLPERQPLLSNSRRKGIVSRLLYLIGNGLVFFGLVGLGVEVEDLINGQSENPFLSLMMLVSFLTIGTFALMAASSRYNGGWPCAIGLCLMALGPMFLGVSLDNYGAESPLHTKIGVILAAGLLAAGAVFFHAGHRAHVRAQRDRQSRQDTRLPRTVDDWRANVR